MSLDLRKADQNTLRHFRDYVRYLMFPYRFKPICKHPSAIHIRNYSKYTSITTPLAADSSKRITTVSETYNYNTIRAGITDNTYTQSAAYGTMTQRLRDLGVGVLNLNSRNYFPVRELNYNVEYPSIVTNVKYNTGLENHPSVVFHSPYTFSSSSPMYTEVIKLANIYEVARIQFSNERIHQLFCRTKPTTSRSTFVYSSKTTFDSILQYRSCSLSASKYLESLSSSYQSSDYRYIHSNERYVIVNLPEKTINNTRGIFNRELYLHPVLHMYDDYLSSGVVNILECENPFQTELIYTSIAEWEGIPKNPGPRVKSDGEGHAFSMETVYGMIPNIQDFFFYPESMEFEMVESLNNRLKNGRL